MKKFKLFISNFLENPTGIKIFITLFSVLFAISIVFVSFLINNNYEKSYLNKILKEKAISTFEEKVKLISDKFEEQSSSIQSIVSNPLFNDFLENSQNKDNISALFEQIINSHDYIMQLRYIDENGMEIIRYNRDNYGLPPLLIPDYNLQNKADRYYFKAIKELGNNKKVWTSNIDLNVEHGQLQKPYVPTVRFGLPVYKDEKFKGVVMINIFMKKTLNYLSKSPMFSVYIMDKDGDFIFGKDTYKDMIIDLSWSKYFNNENKNNFSAQKYLQNILSSYQFTQDNIFSRQISKDLDLVQELYLILKLKPKAQIEMEETLYHKLFSTTIFAIIFSLILGFIFSQIPSALVTKMLKSEKELNHEKMQFTQYLKTMDVDNIISRSDLKGRIIYVNDTFCKITGYTNEEIIGKPHSILRDPEESKETFKTLWLTIQSKKMWTGYLKNRKKNGSFYDVKIAIMPILDERGNILEYLAIRHDITELIKQRQSLVHMATIDSLTNVGNRIKIDEDIKKHTINNLAIIDIDNFRAMNDFYGHKIGDKIIIEFAKLLQKNLDKEYYLYRMHAEKFAILNFTKNNDDFVKFMKNLNSIMSNSEIETNVRLFHPQTTVGISFSKNDIIIETAEIANKHAKKIKKNFLIYSSDLNLEAEIETNIHQTEKIKKALIDNRIIVYYQPIYNNKTKKITKYESLVRLQDENGEIISPYYFLDIAKASNQYIDITKVVIAKSFEKFKNKDISFSINLTIEDILNKELYEYLTKMLEKYKIGDRLIIELVESEGIKEFDVVQKFINHFRLFGCKIAIDDFGTGYSNFEYLIKLNVDFVKIDGSLIQKMIENENILEIVKVIVGFSKKVGYKTIAEYASSKELMDKIIELDIDFAQGYHIGVPKEELV